VAWTLETKTKARSLESKTNFKAKYDSQFNANIPHAIIDIVPLNSLIFLSYSNLLTFTYEVPKYSYTYRA